MPLVIYVDFTVKQGAVERFRELIFANARHSLQDEPGCRRFDVLVSAEEPRRIVLYEIYEDAAAFDFHVTTPHYKVFAAAAEGLLDAFGPEAHLSRCEPQRRCRAQDGPASGFLRGGRTDRQPLATTPGPFKQAPAGSFGRT